MGGLIMKLKVNLTLNLPDDLPESVITNALEAGYQGIGYWFCATDYHRNDDGDIYVAEGIDNELVESFNVGKMKEAHLKEHKKLWIIDRDLVIKGFKTAVKVQDGGILNALKHGYDDILCQMDADDADRIIQYGLFGKLIYG
jgi:hypothetical protein